MKTKMLFILSICLLLFACGEKNPPEKKVKQKTVTKIPEKPKSEIKKEKVLDALPAKKDEHVHGPSCGHDLGAANPKHVSMMAIAQEERMKLAEMLPEEIRDKIAKMVRKRDINGLAEMCSQLSRMGNYKDAFLIASNFLAYAETETEKQMAVSFYANLAAEAFTKRNKKINNINKEEYETVKNLLIESIKNVSDNPKSNQAYLLETSFQLLPLILRHEKDIDTMYELYDTSLYKMKQLDQSYLDNLKFDFFMYTYNYFRNPNYYADIKVSDENINRLLKQTEKISSGKALEIFSLLNSPSFGVTVKEIKENILKYKNYRQKNIKKNEK